MRDFSVLLFFSFSDCSSLEARFLHRKTEKKMLRIHFNFRLTNYLLLTKTEKEEEKKKKYTTAIPPQSEKIQCRM